MPETTDTGLPGAPTPQAVGEFYDANNRAITEIYGGSMHYGYWLGPDDTSDFATAGQRLTDLLIGRLGAGPGDEVLDLGCGTGGPGVRLARATGARVTGVSISAGDVALAGARAEAEGVAGQVRFELADAMELPYRDASFDAVLAFESIVHLPDRGRALREIARVLRPGGRLVLTDLVERGAQEEDEHKRRAVAEMLAIWRAAPMTRAEDYPGFARDAGLVIDEIADITEHTKYTAAHIYTGTRDHLRRHGELPPDLARIHAMGEHVDWAEFTAAEQSDGMIIVVAHRPHTVT
ncbi:type 11 methyltransferase [Streptomyces xiamenensis]|uniref:Type 11 methyltransferase n=1 Tax=Streptomyces xiamenensis TaxID=408015 RepID=A0A0F7FQX5_9ACTN|nr:methyltransferase domain-containing protein [Streptomyces xiamenensis]AKG42304.1 type 11 methyltransferase [Streptomyces xiamenensis]